MKKLLFFLLIIPTISFCQNNFGIGTTTPDSTLTVVGGLKFVTGRQGAGKVLTSDASGGTDFKSLPQMYFDSTVFKGKYTAAHDAAWLLANPVGSLNNPITLITASGGGGGTTTPTYLTLTGLSSGTGGTIVAENNGVRYTPGTPGLFGNVARSINTFTPGKRYVFQLGGDLANHQKLTGFTTTTSFTGYTQLAASIYINNLGDIYHNESGVVTGPIGRSSGADYLSVFYENSSTIRYQQSSDGVTWTTLFTPSFNPAGATYYVGTDMASYPSGNSFLINMEIR